MGVYSRSPRLTSRVSFGEKWTTAPWVALIGIGLVHSTAVKAQSGSADQSASVQGEHDKQSGDTDIVVTGRRVLGSIITDTLPVAILGGDALRSLGATDLRTVLDRLKPLTEAAGGGDPVVLLNGRRISSIGELQGLPPEAIDRTEVLPEQEAARFGVPPTVRVLNFITKKTYRATTIRQLAGTTTEGGGETNFAEAAMANINGSRRTSLSVSHLRLNPILQGERNIAPDTNTPYAIAGNVVGVNGASLDPALDALWGGRVTSASVPAEPALRRLLSSYADRANERAVTDIGRYRTIRDRSDRINVDGTLAGPIGGLDGSINLAMEAQQTSGLNGLAPAVLTVPAGNAYLPFANDVLLYRYLPGAVLRGRSDSLTLHAGGSLQGGIRRWSWTVTSNYDRLRSRARFDQGYDLSGVQAGVDAGGDPLAPIDPVRTPRLVARSETVTGTLTGKAVLNGPLVTLPAGEAQVTASLDYARSTSSGHQPDVLDSALDLTRTTAAARVSAAVPITSPDRDVLAFVGRLSANASIGISDVSRFGRLASSTFGFNWAPVGRVQLTGSLDDARTPPDIALLTSPITTSPNTPFFDFTSGRSELVTVLGGGNPDLAPERRRRTTVALSVQPIKDKEIRLNLEYVNTRTYDQTTTLGSVTSDFQLAFPDAFQREQAGRLLLVDLRATNVAFERERRLRATFNLSMPIGAKPPPAPDRASADGPPPEPASPRPTINATIGATYRLADVLSLRSGSPLLDLLDGATLTGTGGRPRWQSDIDIRGTYASANIGLYGRLQGPTRIRSDLAASDLRFSGRVWLVPYLDLGVEKIVNRPWAKQMSLQFTIENALNDRIDVRDRAGRTPDRFQSAYIDPEGRSVRLGVRKVF